MHYLAADIDIKKWDEKSALPALCLQLPHRDIANPERLKAYTPFAQLLNSCIK